MGQTIPTISTTTTNVEVAGIPITKNNKISDTGYGQLWKCTLPTGRQCALKEVNLKLNKTQRLHQKQVSILKKMKELNFKGSVKIIADDTKPHRQFGKAGFLLLELAQTSLFEQINSKEFTEQQILIVLRDVSSALHELHEAWISHFDLKPQNILLINGRYKLCDFGSCLMKPVNYDSMDQYEQKVFRQFMDQNSTVIFNAPEMIESEGKIIGPAVDIWMLGCIAYILCFGKYPFSNEKEILSGRLSYPSEGYLTDLIKLMLEPNVKYRPTAETIRDKVEFKLQELESDK